jgi:hypothetical protein
MNVHHGNKREENHTGQHPHTEWKELNFQHQFSLSKRPEKSGRLHSSNLYNQIIM